MVDTRVTDGRRIAELLASELDGRSDGALEHLAVTNADRDVEPTADGARAYDVVHDRLSAPLASVFVQPDRVRVAFRAGVDVAAEAGRDADLRVRPAPGPRTVCFVESGAAVKRAADVFDRVVRAVDGGDADERSAAANGDRDHDDG